MDPLDAKKYSNDNVIQAINKKFITLNDADIAKVNEDLHKVENTDFRKKNFIMMFFHILIH